MSGGLFCETADFFDNTLEDALSPAFTIDDADGDGELSMEQLSVMHDSLLQDAKTAIDSTEVRPSPIPPTRASHGAQSLY